MRSSKEDSDAGGTVGNSLLESLFSLEGIPIALADIEGNFTDCNRSLSDLLGYSRDELRSRSIYDLTYPDDIEESREKVIELVRGDTAKYRLEKRYRKKNGDIIWVDVSVSILKEGDGKERSLIGFFKDITHQKELENELRKNSILLESVLNSIDDTIGIQDPDHSIVMYNEAGYRLLNQTPEGVKGKKCHELVGRTTPCEICATSRVYETKKTERVERYEESMDVWLDVRAYPVLDESGEIDYIVEHLRNITDQKNNEIALQQARQIYMDTLNNLHDSVLVINRDYEIELANKSYKTLLREVGIKKKPEGNNIFDLQPFLPEKVKAEYESVFKSNRILETDEINVIDGREYHTLTMKIPLGSGGRVDKIITVIRDTTEQMYYLNELKQGEERMKNILESSPNSIIITDLNGKITDCNEATVHLHGVMNKDDVTGRNLLDFIHEKDHNRVNVNLDRIMAEGRLDDVVYHFFRSDGTTFPGRMSTSIMLDSSGNPEAFIAITLDITERRNFEKDLERRLDYEYLISLISSDFINTSMERMDDTINRTLELAGEFTKADRAYVFLFRDDNTKMDNTHEWCNEGVGSEMVNLQGLVPSDFHVVREFILKKKMIYLPSLRNLPKSAEKDREEFEREGIITLLNAPMICEGELIGFIGFDSVKNQADWDRETIDFLKLIGQIIATTIVRFRFQEQIIKERERAEFYLDLLGHDIGNLHQGIYSSLQIAKRIEDRKIKDLSMETTQDLVQRSIKLVKNVLLLSRLGSREPELQRIDLKQALKDSIHQIKGLFPGKELDIELEMTRGKVFVEAESLVGEVFQNILHNGVKFQDRKSPKLEISLKKNKTQAMITISDHGPGIPASSKKMLFSRFTPKGKGSQTGIGLSLVKVLTERYNGEILVVDRVEGNYRKGAKFILTYPLAR